jgi:hypothetical protein
MSRPQDVIEIVQNENINVGVRMRPFDEKERQRGWFTQRARIAFCIYFYDILCGLLM